MGEVGFVLRVLAAPLVVVAAWVSRSPTVAWTPPVFPIVSDVAPPSRAQTADYQPPVVGALVVLRGFEAPITPFGPGHRGVDLRTPAQGVVLAAATGRVSFAGPVAGRSVIVLTHPDGITTEYEPVRAAVTVGQEVVAGTPIGHVMGTHDDQLTDRCLHWGARLRGDYIDPLGLMLPLGPVRLLPWPRAPTG